MTSAKTRNGRPVVPVDDAKVARLRASGLSIDEIARAIGVSKSTLLRRAKQPERYTPPAGSTAPATPAEPLTSEARRDRALVALDEAVASGEPKAIAAAREILAEHRREVEIRAFDDATTRQVRAYVRLRAAELGAQIRAAAATNPELHALYVAAARVDASPADVDALAAAVERFGVVEVEPVDVLAASIAAEASHAT